MRGLGQWPRVALGTHCFQDGASRGTPRAAHARPYLPGLDGERAHLPGQVHVAQVPRAVPVDAVGVVAGADEHGAEQRAEVEAVALLVLEHRGGGEQVRGLAAAGRGGSARPGLPRPRHPPHHAAWAPARLLRAGQAAGPATPPPPPSAPRSLGPASAPCPCWDKEPAKGGMQTGHPTSRKCHLHLPVILRGHELPHGKDPLD